MKSSIRFRPLTGVLVAVGIVLVVVAVVYFTVPASDLPSVLPGHQAHSNHHHVKHGIAMLALDLRRYEQRPSNQREHHDMAKEDHFRTCTLGVIA